MELMKNKYLNFDTIDTDIGTVRNTTTLNLLPDIPEIYFGENYILTKKIEDDRLLESISYELYESTDYWDILFTLNGLHRMDELPVNFDTILLRVNKELEGWVERGNLMFSNITAEQQTAKYDLLLEEAVEKNEKFRYLKYLSSNNLSSLLADLSEAEDTVKINSNLIIVKE